MKILKCDNCGKDYLRITKLRENHILVGENTTDDIDIDEQRLNDNINNFLSCVGDFCPECLALYKHNMRETFNCVLFRNIK